MRIGIQAVGDNGNSPEVTIEVDYDGTWPETDQGWEDALIVSEPRRAVDWID
ncbi:hypothetical protein RISK_006016 [Rhodopirellula islandica]|uniref:Uncharacterized protein n=2 Tax=Rhodopirellula islandica TaxID=595434 RepID=A0A0J1B523_RHOIS|nr:hypothetical protein RISK_006016 [Rhodopirellula islandica]